ncbi:hypothetical protein Scep_027971 [Stephania cephalantha]|uniref:Protein SCAR n=1 Tax=Stephania cephalantha TaxID=152367 RepID=A0AAP0HJ26_9MAGN
MPLVRVEVRNVYGLGGRELYEATDKDDPKDVLDGVAVAGLVGILRQLGDLAEFAAEVFHDLQEQVMFTAARSRKMIVRVQHIEATLPPLEKAVMSQTSHLHFAYTAGSVWHPSTRTKHNHFIHSDLPRFIMNSYDECRDPPLLHLLDKFDTGGPGVCLRRYSDPSFFKKALAGSDTLNTEKVLREKKATKIKKKGSRRRNGSISWNSGRVPFTSSNSFGQSSANGSFSTSHTRSKSEVINRSLSFDMRTKSGYIECVFGASSSCRHGDQEDIELPSSNLKVHNGNKNDSMHVDEKRTDANITDGSLPDQNASHLTSVTWDEKIEITEPNTQISQKLAKIESLSQFPGVSCDIKHFSGASLTKEQDEEHKHFSTLSLKSKQKGLNGSIDKDKQRADAIDHTNQGLLQDKNSTSPSYVTWHEKVEISVPSSQLPCNVLECENEAQLLCKSGNAESAYSASPSMDHGDQEHQEFSVSTLEVQDGDAIGCNELQELKIEGSDCLAFDSLQELNFPCGSIASRDEFSTSRLNIQQNGDDDLLLHDEMKEGTIDNLAYELIEQNTSQVSSFWSGRMERVEPDSQSSNSTIDEKAEAQLRTQSLEFTKLEKDAAIRGILSMEDITFNSIDLPSEDDQFDEDGSGTDKYMDALNTLESESETDSECQPTQQIKHISAKLRNDEIKHVPLKMHENGQNSEESSDHFVASAPKISSLIYSEDLVQAEPPLITEHSCGPDISEVNVLCQRTHNLDVSVVNPFHSFTMVPSSSGSSISDIEEMHEHCCNMETTIDESLYRSPSSSMEFSKYSENLVHAESPHIVSGFSSPDTSEVNCHSKSTDNLDISEEIALDSSVNIPSSSGFNIADSQDPAETLLLSSFSASLESSTEISDTSSIKVWTNGGLLGLEPSKPLGPSVPNIVKNDFVAGSNENEGNPSNGLLMAKYLSNGSVTELEMLVKNPSQMEKNAKSGLENVSTDFACQNDCLVN